MGQEISLCGDSHNRPISDMPTESQICQKRFIKQKDLHIDYKKNDDMMLHCKLSLNMQEVRRLRQKIESFQFNTPNICSMDSSNYSSKGRSNDLLVKKYTQLTEKLIESLEILYDDIQKSINTLQSLVIDSSLLRICKASLIKDIREKLPIYTECIDVIKEDMIMMRQAYQEEWLKLDGANMKSFANSNISLAKDLKILNGLEKTSISSEKGSDRNSLALSRHKKKKKSILLNIPWYINSDSTDKLSSIFLGNNSKNENFSFDSSAVFYRNKNQRVKTHDQLWDDKKM